MHYEINYEIDIINQIVEENQDEFLTLSEEIAIINQMVEDNEDEF
jgi:hypothetical protein